MRLIVRQRQPGRHQQQEGIEPDYRPLNGLDDPAMALQGIA